MKQSVLRMSSLLAILGCASMLTPVAAGAADNTKAEVEIPPQLVAKLAAIAADNAKAKAESRTPFVLQVRGLPDDGESVFGVFAADADVLAPALELRPDPAKATYRFGTATHVGRAAVALGASASADVGDDGSGIGAFPAGNAATITVNFGDGTFSGLRFGAGVASTSSSTAEGSRN